MTHHGHDHGYKRLFSHPAMMADLLRGYVKDPWVEKLDLQTLERMNGSYVRGDLRERVGDMVWRVRWRDDDTFMYVYLLLEFQSTPERFMALRILNYLGLLYEDLTNRNELTDSGLLPAVLPVVLYQGTKPWKAPQEVARLIAQVPGGLEPYQPRLSYLLLDANQPGQAPSSAQQNLVQALFSLEQSREPADIERILEKLIDWLALADQRELRRSFTVWIKQVLLPARVPGVNFEQLSDLKEVQGMLSERVKEWTETWKEQGLAQGREQGLEQGLEQGRREGEALLLLRLIERRFGAGAKEQHEAQVKAADAETLVLWFERGLDASAVEDIFS